MYEFMDDSEDESKYHLRHRMEDCANAAMDRIDRVFQGREVLRDACVGMMLDLIKKGEDDAETFAYYFDLTPEEICALRGDEVKYREYLEDEAGRDMAD